MTADQSLPKGFEDLQPYVAYWMRDTSDDRWQQRSKASMEDIKDFYDAMLARAEDAIEYLDAFPLDNMPDDAGRLFKLLLAIGQAAIAVEMHRQPRAHHSKFPHDIHLTKGPQFFGG
jgi:hypothetical protein